MSGLEPENPGRDQICAFCNGTRAEHRGRDYGCPIHPPGSPIAKYKFCDNHRFTPKPMPENCIKCGEPTGRAGKGDDSLYRNGAGPFCQGCFDKFDTCPPNCAPFNLKKALAGATLRTRDGSPVRNFGPEKIRELANYPYGAEVFLERQWSEAIYTRAGTYSSGNQPDDLDLFLDASEESGNHLSASPETEIQRQARIEAAASAGVEIEQRDWCAAEADPWEPASKDQQGRYHFTWKYYDHRLRPAPEPKPRLVHLVKPMGSWQQTTPERHDFGLSVSFIELTPAVRKLLEEKGMM